MTSPSTVGGDLGGNGDPHSVVDWSIDATPTAALVTNAHGMAIGSRKPTAGTLIHSDQGVQPLHIAWAFSQRATASGLVPSMGGVGACYDDNAMTCVVLVPDAGLAAGPPALADPPRARQRDLCVPGDPRQSPAPPPQRPGDAQPESSLPTPQDQGHATTRPRRRSTSECCRNLAAERRCNAFMEPQAPASSLVRSGWSGRRHCLALGSEDSSWDGGRRWTESLPLDRPASARLKEVRQFR
jgi:hypothetical protein